MKLPSDFTITLSFSSRYVEVLSHIASSLTYVKSLSFNKFKVFSTAPDSYSDVSENHVSNSTLNDFKSLF